MAKGKMSSSSLDALKGTQTSDSEKQMGQAWLMFRVVLTYEATIGVAVNTLGPLQSSLVPAATGLSETERLCEILLEILVSKWLLRRHVVSDSTATKDKVYNVYERELNFKCN